MGNKLGFGCARLPVLDSQDRGSVDYEKLNKMIDAYMNRGGKYFDTAAMYNGGKSEEALRKSLVERYARDEFLIADKLTLSMINSKDHMEYFFAEQLKRCGVSFFDVYLLHSVMEHLIERIDELGCFDFIKQKKSEGKIRKIGISFHDSADVLEKVLSKYTEIEYVQLQINYLDWDDPIVQSKQCYEVAEQHGKKVIVMEPVRGGTLATIPEKAMDILADAEITKSAPELALQFATGLKNVEWVLSGMNEVSHVTDNSEFLQDFESLSEIEIRALHQIADAFRESIAIPCTSCHYCTGGCPKKIPIPEYFALWNSYRYVQGQGDIRKSIFNNQQYYYEKVMKNKTRASECIRCGQCENICPQHIKCITELGRIADCFE